MKVAMIGNYPPPLCGISVHIKRLADMLESENVKVAVYDIEKISELEGSFVKKVKYKRLWLLSYLFTMNEDIIHIHTHSWKHRAAMTFVSRIRRKGIVITLHSLRAEIEKMGYVDRMLTRYVLKNADRFIAVGESEKKKLVSWGCTDEKIDVIPGFLPPKKGEDKIPKYLTDFVGRHETVIAANGSGIYFYNGQEIYGLDMLVELCERLSHEYDIGFVYCISKGYVNDMEYFENMKRLIRKKNIEDRFIMVTENLEFSSLLNHSGLFIRPTNTDGDAISLREALYLKVPSIASDAAKRPSGTVLFRSRDSDDLYKKTVEVIQNKKAHVEVLNNLEFDDNGGKILGIYKSLTK